MNEITDEEIIMNYHYGWELQSDDKPFPLNFKTYSEKLSCLTGYNDFIFQVVKENTEIIKEVRSKL